jgi:hypothetical protein
MTRAIPAVSALAIAVIMLGAPAAQAGPLERGCLGSERKAASRALCACIQQVADSSLTRRDQRMAARFFKRPHLAQEIRQSDRPQHELFWKRYRAFGDQVERVCAPYG